MESDRILVDGIVGELFTAGLALYLLSLFISFFDYRVGEFLKKIAYLNGVSVLFLIGFQLWALFIRFADALENVGELKFW